jgi:hypothetical protein
VFALGVAGLIRVSVMRIVVLGTWSPVVAKRSALEMKLTAQENSLKGNISFQGGQNQKYLKPLTHLRIQGHCGNDPHRTYLFSRLGPWLSSKSEKQEIRGRVSKKLSGP